MTSTNVAADVFAAAFRAEPTGFALGPGRANLIGEHTDYNLGFVLPFAIDRSAVAAFRPRTDRQIRLATDFAPGVISCDLDHLEGVTGWSAYPLGVAWALGEFGADLSRMPGFDLALHSDVPVGAGLSSSAAIESATALALDAMWQLGLDRRTLARVGQRAENVVVGAPTGIMDQSASLLGEADSAVFLDCRSLEASAIPLGLDAAGLEILVIDTRVSHAHATGGYASRRAQCEEGARELGVGSLREVEVDDLDRAQALLTDVVYRRVRHVVTENQRVLDTVATLRASGPDRIGALLDASHASMRDDFEISVPELDLAVETAVAAGALGARMTGGGFGGSAIALMPIAAARSAQEAISEAFQQAGFRQPVQFEVRAVAGARLL